MEAFLSDNSRPRQLRRTRAQVKEVVVPLAWQPLEQDVRILVKERLCEALCILLWEAVRSKALSEGSRYFKQFNADCTISDCRRRSKVTASCPESQTAKQRSQAGLAFSHGWRS